jgi:cell division protein FtsB
MLRLREIDVHRFIADRTSAAMPAEQARSSGRYVRPGERGWD